MKRYLILAAFAAAGLLALAAAPSRAEVPIGNFHAACDFQGENHDDALVDPGIPGGSHHQHDSLGTQMVYNSTGETLLDQPTNCHRTTDHSSYWIEGLCSMDGGVCTDVPPDTIATYWHGQFDPTKYQQIAPPNGFGEIINREASVNTNGTVTWGCTLNGNLLDPPSRCSTGVVIAQFSGAANCWDGVSAFPDNTFLLEQTNIMHTTAAACHRMGWYLIPGVGGFLQFPVDPNTTYDWKLAFDAGCGCYPDPSTEHMDILFSWTNPDESGTSADLQAVIDACNNDPANRPSKNVPGEPACDGAGT